jgi:MOSC domain-containing protein YiiM
MTGSVIAIYIAPAAEAPMQVVREARVEEGRGIAGDRYYAGTGTFSEKLKGRADREITLIESEQIDFFNRLTGLNLDYGVPRRNVVTIGIGLNELVGVRFYVGEVTLEGVRLCEPCAHLARLVAGEVLPGMVHRAGLRARIVSGGIVKPSDEVDVVAV